MSIKVERSDEAAIMVEAVKDVLAGGTPTQIYQVCANIVGATIVEMGGTDRQEVVDQAMTFGNTLGRVIEVIMIQNEEAENGGTTFDDLGNPIGPQEEETDEEDTDVS